MKSPAVKRAYEFLVKIVCQLIDLFMCWNDISPSYDKRNVI